MSDYFTIFFGLFSPIENQLWLMFASGFLSATLLPGNSEVVFGGIASSLLLSQANQSLIWLFAVAVLGNTLGSLTTYAMALFVPSPKIQESQNSRTQWAMSMAKKYGVWVLFFSWLPVIGDLFCGIAGWLRFAFLPSLLLILLGKTVRYGVILWGIYAVLR